MHFKFWLVKPVVYQYSRDLVQVLLYKESSSYGIEFRNNIIQKFKVATMTIIMRRRFEGGKSHTRGGQVVNYQVGWATLNSYQTVQLYAKHEPKICV